MSLLWVPQNVENAVLVYPLYELLNCENFLESSCHYLD